MKPARPTAASTRTARPHAPSRKTPQLRAVADRLGRDGPAPGGGGWSRVDPFARAELVWVAAVAGVACRERFAGRSSDAQSVLATVGGPAWTAARPGARPSA